MLDSDNFSKKCAQLAHVTYEEKPQIKINSFKNRKNGVLMHTRSYKAV